MLKPRELKQRARALKVENDVIEALDDVDDVKAAAISLLVRTILDIAEGYPPPLGPEPEPEPPEPEPEPPEPEPEPPEPPEPPEQPEPDGT